MDLPEKKLGIDVENGFEPDLVPIPGKEKSRREVTISTDLVYDVLRKHQVDHILLRAARADALSPPASRRAHAQVKPIERFRRAYVIRK